MGTYAHILKDWKNHDPEKVFTDAATVAFRINASFKYNNAKYFFEDGSFRHTSIGISQDTVSIDPDNDIGFVFNIQGVNMEDIQVGLDREFDNLLPNANLCSLAYIEKVRDDNKEFIFRFAYEYLKLNPDEFFWFEWDHLFSLEDLHQLNKRSLDKNWCFKK